MKPSAYQRMANTETEHWYYLSRLRAIEALVRRFVLSGGGPPQILDVGCGTGGTSARLAELGNLTGIEPSPIAIEALKSRYPSLQVIQGTVEMLPRLFPDPRFDLVTILGVLCHRGVHDPQQALDDIAGTLCDRGWLIWGDCVYPCLSRPHDAFVEAERRFYPAQMHRMLQEAGFEIVFSSHFLGWGFPVALGLAAWHRMALAMGWSQRDEVREAVDDRPLPAPLNRILAHLTFWEWKLGLWGLKSPFGVSRLLLARKDCQRAAQRSPGSGLFLPVRGALNSLEACGPLPSGRST